MEIHRMETTYLDSEGEEATKSSEGRDIHDG